MVLLPLLVDKEDYLNAILTKQKEPKEEKNVFHEYFCY